MNDSRAPKAPERKRVFISYPHTTSEIDFARSLANRFREANIDPWLDEERIAGADDVEKRLRQAIEQCDAGVFLLSREWVERDYTREEAELIARADPEGTRMRRVGVLREADVQASVPARFTRFAPVRWHEGDGLTDDERFWHVYAAVMGIEPGPRATWAGCGRDPQNAPAVAIAGTDVLPLPKPQQYPSIECGRTRAWERVDRSYPLEAHQLVLIGGARGEAHDRFVLRIERLLRMDPPRIVRRVQWLTPPVNEGDYVERLAAAMETTPGNLPNALAAAMSTRNLVLLHPIIRSHFDDPALLSYYTQLLPQVLERARPAKRLKCVQPIEWQPANGLRRLAQTLSERIGVGGRWFCSVDEHEARELVVSLTGAEALLRPAVDVFLPRIERDDVRAFCDDKQITGARRDEILRRTRRRGKVRSSDDILTVIDRYLTGESSS